MKTSTLLFRFRHVLCACIFVLGFLAPWNYWLHLDPGRTSWLLLAGSISRNGWLSFDGATVAILVCGMMFAFLAAFLRTWASAYLGAGIAQGAVMQSSLVVSAGPYGRLRNPLYAGMLLHAIALVLLMPPSGAVVTLVLLTALQYWLIEGEELFLRQALGAPYIKYCEEVPAVLPVFHLKISAAHSTPHWVTGLLAETYMWGVAISFAALGWKYNTSLIVRGVLISLGLSLICRALLPRQLPPTPAT